MNFNIYKNMYGSGREIHLINNPRISRMVALVNGLNLKGKKILDFGCLDGTFLSYLDKRNNEFYGVDASDFAVKESRKKGIKVTQYFFDDSKPLPYKDSTFDLIVLGEVIEHIYNTDFLLQELHRVLKNKGLLLISTPNIASFGRRASLLLGINPIIETSPNDADSSGHIRYFTFQSLRDLVQKHFFKEISSFTDVINFTSTGSFRVNPVPQIFKSFGASIIALYRRV